MLPYDKLENPRQYLTKTYLGRRTAGYQAALGCRFRCTFCGVATMFRGKMALPPAARLEQDLAFMKDRLGVDAIQFYDHNFFDREVDMVPLLEVLAKFQLPWWCFARSDALVNLSESVLGAGQKEPAAHGLYRSGVSERLAAARYPQRHAHAIRRWRRWRNAAAMA